MVSRVIQATRVVTLIAVILNVFVYFYPELLNSPNQCNWAEFNEPVKLKSRFEFLNSLPEDLTQKVLLGFPSFVSPQSKPKNVEDIHMLMFGDPQINGNWPSTSYIKRLDNWGNDYYLGHIYNTMKRRLRPSHVAVMGDQFSSQWIYDSEFYNRTNRFVERLFTRPAEYKQTVLDVWKKHQDFDWESWMRLEQNMDPLHKFQTRVYEDVYDWVHPESKTPNFDAPLFINLTGNHDIGYSGDATWQHMARFHLLFGQNNYLINYNKGTPQEWRLVVLDSLTLDGPPLQQEFLDYTWSFLDHIESDENPNFKGATVLLTHIPLYKAEGLCADGPEHKYYIDNDTEPYKNGLLRSQNHLSYEASKRVMEVMFPNADQNGVILTGHDHVGCDDWYNKINGEWVAGKEKDVNSESKPVREVVVRAMMGDYGGQTGVFTGHFDKSWDFEFTYCSFTVQHWWWASKVFSWVAIFLQTVSLFY